MTVAGVCGGGRGGGAYARAMALNRKALDDLRETVGRLGDQLGRTGLRGVEELVGDRSAARPGPARPLAVVQAELDSLIGLDSVK